MNITTLNTTTLDGNVIIKKGGGGGATINNQDKVVDITENGTTEVVADSEFTGLGKVTINTEVSGGESGGSNEYEYYALTDGWLNDLGMTFPYFSSLVKTTTSGAGVVIAPVLLAKVFNDNKEIDPAAVAVDMSLLLGVSGQQMTIKESILGSGTTEESLAKYRITKEQFYDLN